MKNNVLLRFESGVQWTNPTKHVWIRLDEFEYTHTYFGSPREQEYDPDYTQPTEKEELEDLINIFSKFKLHNYPNLKI